VSRFFLLNAAPARERESGHALKNQENPAHPWCFGRQPLATKYTDDRQGHPQTESSASDRLEQRATKQGFKISNHESLDF
jgi:hypothetical protein